MIGLVQVHADAHVAQRRIGLRRPRAARLSVRDRRDAEDALDVADALHLATIELGSPVVPAGVLQVHGNGRLLAVRVRVVADVVLAEARRSHRVGPRLSSTRAFSPTILNVARTPSRVNNSASRFVASSSCGRM